MPKPTPAPVSPVLVSPMRAVHMDMISRLTAQIQEVAPITGVSLGASPPSSVRIDYAGNATQPQKDAAQAIVNGFLYQDRVSRSLQDIYTDLNALTGTQKTAIWTDLSSGTPKKYLTDPGPNMQTIGALHFLISQTTANWNATDLTGLKMQIAMNYVFDRPWYLEHPSWAPTINISGDTPVS